MGRAKSARGARGRRRKAAIVKMSGRDGHPLCALAFCTWMSDQRSRCSPGTFRRRHVNGPNASSTYSVGPSFHTADTSASLGQPKLPVSRVRAPSSDPCGQMLDREQRGASYGGSAAIAVLPCRRAKSRCEADSGRSAGKGRENRHFGCERSLTARNSSSETSCSTPGKVGVVQSEVVHPATRPAYRPS